MNIPLDNLYDWIQGMLPAPAVIYLFYPHGKKNISNLTKHTDSPMDWFDIPVIMHDQEPLDYDFYINLSADEIIHNDLHKIPSQLVEYERRCAEYCAKKNLAYVLYFAGVSYEKIILIHSEKNSKETARYLLENFLPVYYWSHAIIARDWYRFAQIDTRFNLCVEQSKTFLIYCRDWSHRREYRLKFVDLLIEHNLQEFCQISMSKNCSDGYPYINHEFINSDFALHNNLDSIPDNHFDSNESARYIPDDFNNTKISVVLETVFDDQRIHLTEKILRSIACAHPFLLAAGPGSLEYLRSYGFKTFDPWIDESYDQEPNSLLRLKKIVNSMKKINNLNHCDYLEIKQIAKFNQQHFFSCDFEQQITQELQNNLNTAFDQIPKPRDKFWRKLRNYIRKNYPEQFQLVREYKSKDYTRSDVTRREKLRCLRSKSNK
jgi:hypothetical protein